MSWWDTVSEPVKAGSSEWDDTSSPMKYDMQEKTSAGPLLQSQPMGLLAQTKMQQGPEGGELRTQYPEVSGFVKGAMGTAPDELGGSVLDPQSQREKSGAEYGYPIGPALQMLPGVGPAGKGVGRVAKAISEAEASPRAGSRAAQLGVIKMPGGNWIKDSVEETLASLKKPPTSRYENPNITESEFEKGVSHSEAINTWIDKKLTPYVKNDMATERDPIRALAEKGITHLPQDAINRGAWEPEHLGQVRRSEKFPESGLGIGETARSWEGLSDEAVQITAPMMQTTETRAANPWLEKLPPNQTIYRARKADIRELGFDHITDVLREQLAAGELTPEALSKVTVADAVKRTHEYDQAAKAAAAKYRAKAAEGAPVAMEFPTGDKLTQLNQPGQFAAESDAMGHSVRGYEPEQGHADWIKESGNRGSSGYGHGGWEAIKSGKAEVYSLRDPENVSSATIEAKKGKPWNERSGIFYDNPELEPSWRKFSTEASLEEKAKGLNRPSNYIERYPEWLKTNDPEMFAKHADIFESNPLDITQIKGGGNGSISYNKSEHVKDFLNSKTFGKVNLDQLQGITDTTNEQSLSNLAGDLYAESGKPRHLMIQDVKDAIEANNLPRFISRSDMLKVLGLAGATGAASAQTKGNPMDKSWLDEISTPVAKTAKEDTSYDMEEFAPPADETTIQRIKRLGRTAAKESEGGKAVPIPFGLPVRSKQLTSALKGAGEAGLSAVSGLASTAVGGLAGLARGGYNLAAGEGVEESARKMAETGRAIQKAGTYEPRTATGKLYNELSAAPMTLASEYLGKGGEAVGGAIGEALGGEKGKIYGGAAGRSVGELAPSVAATLLGGKAALTESGKKPTSVTPSTPKEASAIRFQNMGYVLPPSEARPSLLNRFVTGYGGKIQTEQAASIKNQPVTNNLAKKALGIPETVELSVDVLENVRAEAGKSYQAIKDTKEPIYTNQTYQNSIQELSKDWQAAERDFPEIVKNKSDIIELQNTMNKAQMSPVGALEMVKNLRGESKTNLKNFQDPAKQALGRAQKQAANALDQLVEDNLKENTIVMKANPQLVDDYRAAREVIAKSYDVEAALNDATNNVDAAILGKMLKKQRLSGYLKDVAEFQASFKKSAQMPEKIGTNPGISPLDVATAGIEGTAALSTGKPGLAAGAVGTVLGRPAARGLGLSEMYQRGPGSAQRYDMSGRSIKSKIAPAAYTGAQQAQEANQ